MDIEYGKPLLDIHTHTIASGHAYSTLKENIEEAKRQGLKVLGTSEHAPMMPGTANIIYFRNFRVIPREISGVRIYHGIEANIYNYKGCIDVEEDVAVRLDYVIASMHDGILPFGTKAQNTAAVIGAIENPLINIIGHPDDGRFPIDPDEIAQAASENNKVLEVNNSSQKPDAHRLNGPENMRKVLESCKKYKTMVIMGSDSHICYDIGNFRYTLQRLEETSFPREQVINFDLEKLNLVLHDCAKNLFI